MDHSLPSTWCIGIATYLYKLPKCYLIEDSDTSLFALPGLLYQQKKWLNTEALKYVQKALSDSPLKGKAGK